MQPHPLKVHLLSPDDPGRGPEFHAEPEPAEAAVTHPGLRGWVERKLVGWKHAIQHAEGGLAARVRQLWEWLNRRTHPDEGLLARLRSAPSVEVHHPPHLTEDEVRAAWLAYLASRRRRHWPWFVFDLVLTPLSVLLAPLPGPNVLGYWFTYRAVRHLLILLGLRRARSGRIATSWHAGSKDAGTIRNDLEPSGASGHATVDVQHP